MYAEITCLHLRDNLRQTVDRLMTTGERVMVTRHGKPVAALVSPRDLEALEEAANNRELFLRARQEAQLREFRALKEGLDGGG